jgi:hypothetical protein
VTYASPFIASKGRAPVIFMIKGVKTGRMKEKNKKVVSGVVVFLLIQWE